MKLYVANIEKGLCDIFDVKPVKTIIHTDNYYICYKQLIKTQRKLSFCTDRKNKSSLHKEIKELKKQLKLHANNKKIFYVLPCKYSHTENNGSEVNIQYGNVIKCNYDVEAIKNLGEVKFL